MAKFKCAMEKMVKKRKILITGNCGYIGPVIAKHFKEAHPDYSLIGFDNGYFSHCLTNSSYNPIFDYDFQYWGDIRNFPEKILDSVDSVIHLAAISNDPMGKKYENVTKDINFISSLKFANLAKSKGINSFVFSSSCSIYGYAEEEEKTEESSLNPLTQYARSKVLMEEELFKIADQNFNVTALRFATACGMSDRLRLDLVLNDFVASAIAEKKISILSDGSPWRPLINVMDMSRAISWALNRDKLLGNFVALNTGSKDWNYQILDLAEAVAEEIPNLEIKINPNAAPDKRSYRVNFEKFTNFASNNKPIITLSETIKDLKNGLTKMNFNDQNFRESSEYVRLNTLEELKRIKLIDKRLNWTKKFKFLS